MDKNVLNYCWLGVSCFPAQVGAIIGTRGVKVNEIMQSSGADINVAREQVTEMFVKKSLQLAREASKRWTYIYIYAHICMCIYIC